MCLRIRCVKLKRETKTISYTQLFICLKICIFFFVQVLLQWMFSALILDGALFSMRLHLVSNPGFCFQYRLAWYLGVTSCCILL